MAGKRARPRGDWSEHDVAFWVMCQIFADARSGRERALTASAVAGALDLPETLVIRGLHRLEAEGFAEVRETPDPSVTACADTARGGEVLGLVEDLLRHARALGVSADELARAIRLAHWQDDAPNLTLIH